MIRGIDISHWQGKINWPAVKTDFVFIKATQGTSYVDTRFKENRDGVRKAGILLGFYHFAAGQDPVKEAEHFVSTIGELRANEIVILDWEIEAKDPVGWCRTFLDRVFERTGVRALLYTNMARVQSLNWKRVVDGNYGLWVARYPKPDLGIYIPLLRPTSGQWPFWVLWQYSSKGKVNGIVGNVDMNHGDINLDVLKKYGKQKAECNHSCLLHCK